MHRFRILLLLLVSLLVVSCVDEDSMLGLGLVDESDKVNVGRYTYKGMPSFIFHEGDSLKTSNFRYTTLGSYSDNEFGKVTTSIYTQLSLSSTSQDFTQFVSGKQKKADSLILTLAYAGAFSKDSTIKSVDMVLEIYEITEPFAPDSVKSYYANNTMQYNPVPLFKETLTIKPYQKVALGKDTVAPHLRINLSGEFLEKLLQHKFNSNQEFKKYLKGLHIKATPKDNSKQMIAYFDMYASFSGLFMYYHDINTPTTVEKYQLVFDDKSRRFNHIDYDFSGSDINRFSSNPKDTINTQQLTEKLYVGNLGMSLIKIDIEDVLKEWYKDSTNNLGAFNQAMLKIPINEEYLTKCYHTNYPARLICFRKDSTNKLVYIHDAFETEHYMGLYNAKEKAYKMRITSHLQNYLNGNIKDPNIYLIPEGRTYTASRVILNSPKHPTNPAKIEIIYTK